MKKSWRILALVSFVLGAVQWLHAAPFAYLTHQSGVSVVDLAFGIVVAELPTNATAGVATNTEANRAYVSDRDKVSILDMRAQAVIATTPLPTLGGPIVLRPNRPEAYVVTDHCSNLPNAACTADLSTVIRILNTDNNALVGSIADSNRTRIAFSPDGTVLFVARFPANDLLVLNAATRQLIATVPLGRNPQGMATDAAGRFLYVAEHGDNADGQTVAVVDTATRTLAGRITVGTGPRELVLGAGRLFVTNSTSNTVSVVDTTSRAVIATIPVGQRPMGIDIAPGGEQVVVANNGSASASLIDPVGLRVSATVGVGAGPGAIGRFIGGTSAPQVPDALTGLWFNPAEPGWGVHVAHRGSRIFAAWFTYNASGAPKWYVSSNCVMNTQLPCPTCTGEATCTGNIFETTGPRFFADPYNPGAVSVRELGLFQMGFTDRNTGAMSFVIGSTVKTMPLRRQVFRGEGPAPAIDYTDLWWNPVESGWGIGITQQFGTMFLAWFAYDDSGTPVWYVASNCAVNASGNGCTGDLYRTNGPDDPIHNPFDASRVRVNPVGSVGVSFTDANSGTLSYTVDGKSGVKSITRQVF